MISLFSNMAMSIWTTTLRRYKWGCPTDPSIGPRTTNRKISTKTTHIKNIKQDINKYIFEKQWTQLGSILSSKWPHGPGPIGRAHWLGPGPSRLPIFYTEKQKSTTHCRCCWCCFWCGTSVRSFSWQFCAVSSEMRQKTMDFIVFAAYPPIRI